MSIPSIDSSNKKGAFFSYQMQVKTFGRQHDFEKVLTGKQTNVYVIADGVSTWDLEARFGNRVAQENTKA